MADQMAVQLLADASPEVGEAAQHKHMQVLSIGPLAMPVPDNCTDQYAAGWAAADLHVKNGGSDIAEPAVSWSDDKANGFTDRLRAERAATERS